MSRVDTMIVACVIMIFLLCFLSAYVWPQELPNAPSSVQRVPVATVSPCGATGCWDYDHPNLTVGQTFRSPWFLGPVGVPEASYWADVGFSLAAIHRGCTEGNPDLSARPVLGDYFVNWAKTELPLDILQWSLAKLNRKPARVISMAMSGARVGIHLNGVAAAMRCR